MAKQAIPISDLPVVNRDSIGNFNTDRYQTGAIVLMNKPLKWSSFDVVGFVRNRIPPKKVGHAGTLDPLASGLLILCTGKATRSVSQVQNQEKVYHTTIRFGASTPSYDSALEPDETAEWKHITEESISQVLSDQFTGTIWQVPPLYSAIQVKGERLYKKARRGEDFKPPPRQVTIHKVEVLECRLPEIDLKITCGKGTYIRSIAHDLGLALNSRSYITSLRRTKIGSFSVVDAIEPIEFSRQTKN